MSSSENPNKPGPRLVTPDTDVAIPKPPEEFSFERNRSRLNSSGGLGIATSVSGVTRRGPGLFGFSDDDIFRVLPLWDVYATLPAAADRKTRGGGHLLWSISTECCR